MECIIKSIEHTNAPAHAIDREMSQNVKGKFSTTVRAIMRVRLL